MAYGFRIGLPLAVALIFLGGIATAEEAREHPARPAPAKAEPHPGPKAYQPVAAPKGWNARPATVNRATYQHNYQAARSFKIGPYHYPTGWQEHRWVYGQILPPAYWTAEYIIGDYWLFGF